VCDVLNVTTQSLPIRGIDLLKSFHFSQVKETSHVVACEFVVEDHIAQLCLRIVQWLEGLASKALDLEAKVLFSYIFCMEV
jgi:hypothetical protein